MLCATGRWAEAEALLIDALGPPTHPTIAAPPADARPPRDPAASTRAASTRRPSCWPRSRTSVTSCEPLARVHLARGELDLGAAVARRGVVRAGRRRAAGGAAARRARRDRARPRATSTPPGEAADDLAARRRRGRPRRRSTPTPTVAHGRVLAALGDHRRRARGVHRRHAPGSSTDDRPLASAAVRLELAEVLAADGTPPAAIAEGRAALAVLRPPRRRAGPRPGRRPAADAGRHRPVAPPRCRGGGRRPDPAREREVLDAGGPTGLTNAADRRAAVHLAEDGRAPRRPGARQARRPQPGRGGGAVRAAGRPPSHE